MKRSPEQRRKRKHQAVEQAATPTTGRLRIAVIAVVALAIVSGGLLAAAAIRRARVNSATNGSMASAAAGGACCDNRPARFGVSTTPLPAGAATAPSTVGMVWIPGGEFTMGTDDPGAYGTGRPSHRVKVSSFWMDETAV